MIFLLLKVGGLEYVPEHILNDWALEPSRLWQVGEVSPTTGQPHEDAGFNLTLPNHEAWPDALAYLRDLLDTRTEMFHELISMGATMELHVGVSVDADEAAQPLEIPRGFMADLLEREIDLNLLAFQSGENNA
jgi:hypothetical protein